jgi:serine phosphatase RsbU (regulator of sigma subunit)
MEAQIAVAKVRKYATSTSGDTVEVVERPNGGLSIVMADGQSSGRGAKWVSSFVVRKAITLLAEGVRDGAAARAASDALYTERSGKVSATLNILSVDMQTKTLVITRNNPSPVLLAWDDKIKIYDSESKPVGYYRDTRPSITEVPLEPGLSVVVFTDGIVHAGSRDGRTMDVETCLKSILEDGDPTAQEIADTLLEHAVNLDRGRPVDDTSVIALRVTADSEDTQIRRMLVSLPIGFV